MESQEQEKLETISIKYYKMRGSMRKTGNQEGRKDRQTKKESTPPLNRGVQMMLFKRKKEEPEEPKTFEIGFGKLLVVFKKTISITFHFTFDIK